MISSITDIYMNVKNKPFTGQINKKTLIGEYDNVQKKAVFKSTEDALMFLLDNADTQSPFKLGDGRKAIFSGETMLPAWVDDIDNDGRYGPSSDFIAEICIIPTKNNTFTVLWIGESGTVGEGDHIIAANLKSMSEVKKIMSYIVKGKKPPMTIANTVSKDKLFQP